MKKSHPAYRFLTQKIYKLSVWLSFLLKKLSLGEKFSILFLSICLVSLFFTWATLSASWSDNTEAIRIIWGFSPLLWNIAFFLAPLLAFGIYKILHSWKNIKSHVSLLKTQNSQLIFWISLIVLISSLHSYLSIRGLWYFDASIQHGFWLILTITSAIMLLWNSFILQREELSRTSWSFIGEKYKPSHPYNPQESEENMKLPV